MAKLMGMDTGGNGEATAQLAEQERRTRLMEQQQAAQLQSRRKAMGSGSSSKTIFAAVDGIGASTAKKVKLGE